MENASCYDSVFLFFEPCLRIKRQYLQRKADHFGEGNFLVLFEIVAFLLATSGIQTVSYTSGFQSFL